MAPLLGTLGILLAAGSPARAAEDPARTAAFPREEPFVIRPLSPWTGERRVGNGIAYGPHRDGQRPGGRSPSREELRQDLRIMSRHWSLLRLYGTAAPTETILDLIREDRLDLKVMLGVWIDAEERRGGNGEILERFPEVREANQREVDAAVRLAAVYAEIVFCLCVGNETQVSWSSHRVPPELLIGYVREVRARTKAPVTS